MGQLSASVALLTSSVPKLPTRLPVWMLIVPCGVGGLITVVVGGAHLPLQALAMVAIGSSIVLVAHHPAWVVLPPLIVDFSLGGHQVPGVGTSLRTVVTFMAAVIALVMLARSRSTAAWDAPTRWVALPTMAFIVLSTVINLLFSDLPYVAKYLRYQIGLGVTLALVLLFLRSRRAISILAMVALSLAVVSSMVAVGQRIGGPLALYTTPSIELITAAGSRTFGLAGSPVVLANTLLSVVVPLLGLLVVAWPRLGRARLPLVVAALVILVGIYLSTTRSAFLGVAAGTAVIMAAVDAPRRFALAGVGVVAALLLGAAVIFGLVDDRFLASTDEDKSAAGHVAIGQVAIAVALDHAVLGIGREHFARVSRAYASEVSLGGGGRAQQSGVQNVGLIEPHNDFLTVWCSWGIFGLAAYLGILYGTMRNYLIARRSADPFVRGLAVGCLAGVVAYAVNSSLHNSLDSSVILWYYAGLSATLATIPERAVSRVAALRRRPPCWSARRHAGAVAATA